MQKKTGSSSVKLRRHWCPQKYCSKAMKEIIQVSLASATLKGALKEISKTEMREIQMVLRKQIPFRCLAPKLPQ